MADILQNLESQLDSFDLKQRRQALEKLAAMAKAGEIQLPETGSWTNVHFHTFYSFNFRDYSPSKIAWLAKKEGLAAAGIVDFDVLDGLEEFIAAAGLVGVKAFAGMESRVYVPEFADKVINSPGEPGISYHMGVGFPAAVFSNELNRFRQNLQDTAQQRNRQMVDRINSFLRPVELDFEKDVYPLVPAGNPTERHLCLAYARKAKQMFPDEESLRKFWTEKLGQEAKDVELPESAAVTNLIRAKTMKKGGVGYAQPDVGSFPKMADMNAFVLKAGGMPVATWLNGLSDGEQQMDKLLDIAMSTGVCAFNIIPDRNYTPGLGQKDEKCRELYKAVELAKSRDLPIIAGTEMNSPGQKFVDNFESAELAPLVPEFLKGALIVYAHSALQRNASLGYTSGWANANFYSASAKNDFFEKVGMSLEPGSHNILKKLPADVTPKQILSKIEA